jgi:hypothetical protein
MCACKTKLVNRIEEWKLLGNGRMGRGDRRGEGKGKELTPHA